MKSHHLLTQVSEALLVAMQISLKGEQFDSITDVEQNIDCSTMTLDSREIVEGSIFLAIKGYQADGRDYISAAIEDGASVIFYEAIDIKESHSSDIQNASCLCIGVANLHKHASEIAAIFYEFPSEKLQVYGITGTNGKTSCAYLLAQSFNQLTYKTAFMGTIGVGLPDELVASTHTTLDAVSLQRYMAQLVSDDFSHVCIEVSSHALDQCRVAAVNFYAVLYTNLGQDHLDYHLNMQAYAAAKKQLFTQFNPTLAVINIDDEFGQALLDEVTAEFVVSYGKEESGADVVSEEIVASRSGLSVLIVSESLEFPVSSNLVGLLNVPNLTLVVTTMLALGVESSDINKVIQASHAAPGRMELFVRDACPMIVVDYAHTPDALKLALQSCRIHCEGELWVVFGCGGDRDQSKRELMGQMAEQYADKVIVCSDNPRSEDPMSIIANIETGMTDKHFVIENRSKAVAYAIEQAAANDVILVAGKGHETGQIVGSKVLPYSDRDWVKSCLEAAA